MTALHTWRSHLLRIGPPYFKCSACTPSCPAVFPHFNFLRTASTSSTSKVMSRTLSSFPNYKCSRCSISSSEQRINHRRACAARVTIILSSLELLFVLKMLTYTAGNGGRKFFGVFPETASFRTTALSAL